MKLLLYLLLILATSSSSAIEQKYNHPSNCIDNEIVIFSCKIGKKFASLCASEKPLSVSYRFGKLNKHEMIFPTSKLNSNLSFKEGVSGYGTNGVGYVYFQNSNYKYFIYVKTIRNTEIEGVLVFKDDELLVDLKCDSYIEYDNWGITNELKIMKEDSKLMDRYITN